jgi:hypothetical protein
MPDQWEIHYFGDLSRDGTGDYDADGNLDIDEFTSLTNPADIEEEEDNTNTNTNVETAEANNDDDSGGFCFIDTVECASSKGFLTALALIFATSAGLIGIMRIRRKAHK